MKLKTSGKINKTNKNLLQIHLIINKIIYIFSKRKKFQNGISPTNVHAEEASEWSACQCMEYTAPLELFPSLTL